MERDQIEEQKYIRAKKRVKQIKGFYRHLTVYVIVNSILIILNISSDGDWKSFWEFQTFSTAIFWGIGILFHAFNVFGLSYLLGKSWEEKKIKELMNKDKREFWE